MNTFDRLAERCARRLARNISRRNLIARAAKIFVASAFVYPILPWDRVLPRAEAADGGKDSMHPAKGSGANHPDTSCEYWRYCALDGYLCTCCGGSTTACPPGTEVANVAWIGTCRNAEDGKHYLISYNDCCGSTPCGRCECDRSEGERPAYRLGQHNDVDWCMGNTRAMYHCTIAVAVGTVDRALP
jgi:amicyanin-dependent methylamine dehydrogenase small subunit